MMVGQHGYHSNVVSGESASEEDKIENEDIFSIDDDNEEEGEGRRAEDDKHQDFLYDENLDDDDEAYVYKHMRGGITEPLTMLMQQPNSKNNNDRPKSTRAPSTSNKFSSSFGYNKSGCSSSNNNNNQKSYKTQDGELHLRQVVQVYKSRSSDAVLSCPCCFNIICMDCQRHKRYVNQFRAMFVMGVVVDWNNILVYDDDHRSLVSSSSSKIVGNHDHRHDHHEELTVVDNDQQQQQLQQLPLHTTFNDEGRTSRNSISRKQQQNDDGDYDNYLHRACAKSGEYYSVECATCRTQVAALDMTDEVYHFFGCIESSSAF